MRPATPLALVLALSLFMGGCLGGGTVGGPADASESSPSGTSPDSGQGDPTPPPVTDPDAAFHTHDMWGLAEKLLLYDGTVSLAQDPLDEVSVTSQGVRVGLREFTTEDDGDDDAFVDKTDIVLQGTSEIQMTFTYDTQQIRGLTFLFKHANTPAFAEFGQVASGQTYALPLKAKWADMAHQDHISRWRFQLAAHDPQTSVLPFPVEVARGDVKVHMEILKGDASFLDPPHPYFFTHGDHRSAGEVQAHVQNAIVLSHEDADLQLGAGLDGHKPAAPNIIPWETNLLKAWLYYNYTGPAAPVPHEAALKFHGADTLTYARPTPVETAAGYAYYEITVDPRMTDSPYAVETDWEFGIYPITADQANQGDFTGDFHIVLEAWKR